MVNSKGVGCAFGAGYLQASIVKGIAFRAVLDGFVTKIAGVSLVLSVVSKCAGVAGAVSGIADSAASDKVGAGHALVV